MTTPDTTPTDGGSYNVDQPPLEDIKRHDEFYISDGGNMSIFLVERTLYKVHRYFLARESSVFRTMFGCPHPVEGQDGESDEKPIRLSGVSCSEFEALLDFLYNGMFAHARKKSESSNRKAFYDLLSFSLLYEFDRVTTEVVACIDDCGDVTDPVTKICFGVAHDSLRHWVPPAYNALIERDHFLTKDEIVRLGAGRTAIVGSIREEMREKRQKTVSNPFQVGEPSRSAFGFNPGVAAETRSSKSTMEVPPQFYSV